jgi:peptidyl-Lys metalloendopeptidase
MFKIKNWVWSVAISVAATGLQAAPRDPIDVQLSVPSPVLKGDVDVVVTVTVTNQSNTAVSLLKSQLPASSLQGPLFRITRNEERVAYQGRVVKRVAPQAADLVRLEPGASLHYDVELTAAYDLSQSGRYTIEYVSRGRHGDAVTLSSAPLYLWLEERSGPVASGAQAPVQSLAQSLAVTPASVSFSSCSASQQTTIKSAITAATNYATEANAYLSATPAATQRFKKWFGSSTSRWSTVKSHFAATEDAFKTKAVTTKSMSVVRSGMHRSPAQIPKEAP